MREKVAVTSRSCPSSSRPGCGSRTRSIVINTFKHAVHGFDNPRVGRRAVAQRLANDFIEEHIGAAGRRSPRRASTSWLGRADRSSPMQIQPGSTARIATDQGRRIRDKLPGGSRGRTSAQLELTTRLRMRERRNAIWISARSDAWPSYAAPESRIRGQCSTRVAPRTRVAGPAAGSALELAARRPCARAGFTDKHPDIIYTIEAEIDEVKATMHGAIDTLDVDRGGEPRSQQQPDARREGNAQELPRRATVRGRDRPAEDRSRTRSSAHSIEAHSARSTEQLEALARQTPRTCPSSCATSTTGSLAGRHGAGRTSSGKSARRAVPRASSPPSRRPSPASPNRLVILVVGLMMLGGSLGAGGRDRRGDGTDSSLHGPQRAPDGSSAFRCW